MGSVMYKTVHEHASRLNTWMWRCRIFSILHTFIFYISFLFFAYLQRTFTKHAFKFFTYICTGTAVAQWLRYCATNQKVAGSIPDGVMEFFVDINPSDRPGVDSASNRNEYHVYFLGVNAAGAYGWQPYHHPAPLSRNLGTLTSWNALGHSRPVTGLLYLYLYL
jgi:hypothetical protein